MSESPKPFWPEGLTHALITSNLSTPQINLILAEGVVPAHPLEKP